MAKRKVANLIEQIQKRENLDSMEQVFDAYPALGEFYYRECQGESFDTEEVMEIVTSKKKNLLLG